MDSLPIDIINLIQSFNVYYLNIYDGKIYTNKECIIEVFESNKHLSIIDKLHICNLKKGTEDMFFSNTLSNIITLIVSISDLTIDFNLVTINEKITFTCFLLKFKKSLKSLTFGNEFNHRLYNILDILINLKSLTFGENFCNGSIIIHDGDNIDEDIDEDRDIEDLIQEPPVSLGNSLSGLKKLETLVFGNKFNLNFILPLVC